MLAKTLLFGPLVALPVVANSQLACPPLGPVLPPPLRPSTDSTVQAAVADLETKLRNLTSSFNGTAVSIAAEIIALQWGGRGDRLTDRDGPVHHHGL